MSNTALGFPFGFFTNDNLPQDAKYFNRVTKLPYNSKSEVNVSITQPIRHIGLTVNINGVEYWYEDGVLDTNLVEKVVVEIQAGDNITIDGNGTPSTPYVINSTNSGGVADGSETKIISGTTTTKTGTGTTINPYKIETVNLQKVITYPDDFVGINYTLTNADNQYTIFINNGNTPVTITIDTSVTTPNFCVGFIQEGVSSVGFQASTVFLTNPVGLYSKGQGYQTFIERKMTDPEYHLLGNTRTL